MLCLKSIAPLQVRGWDRVELDHGIGEVHARAARGAESADRLQQRVDAGIVRALAVIICQFCARYIR